MRWIFLAAALLIASPLCGQQIGGLSTIPPITEGRFPVTGLAAPTGSIDELSKWASRLVVAASGPDGAEHSIEVDIGLVKRQPIIYFSADRPGLYVLCLIDTAAKEPAIVSKRVQVGDLPPNPPPPGPGPPSPQPTPAPIPLTGLRVLLIYESDPTSREPKLTREQSQIMTGLACRTELSAICAKDAKGNPEYRFFDDDTDMSNAPEHWRDAMRRPRKQLPWLIVSDGVKGYEGPLPANQVAFLDLLRGFKQ